MHAATGACPDCSVATERYRTAQLQWLERRAMRDARGTVLAWERMISAYLQVLDVRREHWVLLSPSVRKGSEHGGRTS